jgi:hypothetical protein
MPKVRLLVARDIDGKPQAAGAEVDVSDEVAAELKAAGAASLIEDEQAAEKAAQEGNYSARMTRDQAGGVQSEETQPEKPQPEEGQDKSSRRGRTT